MSSDAPATPSPVFSVRIVSIDHYMARPQPGLDVCYSTLEGTVVERVPVVRIFGTTPMGQKTCLHLHKVHCFLPLPQRMFLLGILNEKGSQYCVM